MTPNKPAMRNATGRRLQVSGAVVDALAAALPLVVLGMAMLYSDRIGPRLAIGWTMGTLVSALGVYLSLQIDLPTGATIVCTFGLVLILMALLRPVIRKRMA